MNIKTIIFFVNYAPRFQNFDSLTDQTRRPKEGDQYSQRPEALIIVRQKKNIYISVKGRLATASVPVFTEDSFVNG